MLPGGQREIRMADKKVVLPPKGAPMIDSVRLGRGGIG
jgi:hypothetical protein